MLRLFSQPRYLALSIFIAIATYVIWVTFQMLPFLQQLIASPGFYLSENIPLIAALFASTVFEYAPSSISLIAVLIGINATLMVYSARTNHALSHSGFAGSTVGMILGILGTGCAACGSLLLAPFLASFGAGGILAFFPYGGVELKWASVAILSLSIVIISTQIHKAEVCKI